MSLASLCQRFSKLMTSNLKMASSKCLSSKSLSLSLFLHTESVSQRYTIKHIFGCFADPSPLMNHAVEPRPGGSLILQRFETLNQMHRRGGPIKLKIKKMNKYLNANAYKRGVVLKLVIKKPKKPNSAQRKCVRIKLSNGKEATAYIPGEGHNLQEHSIVLVRGGRLQDVPGVSLQCVRGKYDLAHVKKK